MSSVCRRAAGGRRLAGLRARTPAAARAGAARRALRVCADPNNMPFSNRQRQGFENRIAELVARDCGRPLAYFWSPQRRGFIRNTLNAGRCDVVIGVPAQYDRVQPTRPYYRSTYAFVSRATASARSESFDDPRLKTLTIGIQITGDDYDNPPAAQALAARHLDRERPRLHRLRRLLEARSAARRRRRRRRRTRRRRGRLGTARRLLRPARAGAARRRRRSPPERDGPALRVRVRHRDGRPARRRALRDALDARHRAPPRRDPPDPDVVDTGVPLPMNRGDRRSRSVADLCVCGSASTVAAVVGRRAAGRRRAAARRRRRRRW